VNPLTEQNQKFSFALTALLVMIIGLMALGAGVRTMNAGLSCPDWPLCYGKVIPDFHPGVYFEFIHRAYAGLVAIAFSACCLYALRAKDIPVGTRRAAAAGLIFLILQIVMGGLTVLLQVRAVIVTSHLMLATFFFISVLFMSFNLNPSVRPRAAPLPRGFKISVSILPCFVLLQIFVGGLVASTYAGLVCVDWPRCNGAWIPTLSGILGLQIIHRLIAYALVLCILVFAGALHFFRNAAWMNKQIRNLVFVDAGLVIVQVLLGIANLLLFIPPHITVAHQTVAVLLLATNLRLWFVSRPQVASR
jgi:cytochrome c oxidase assembly protein subunit 15